MYYGYNDTRTDRERQLEYELEEARLDAERQRERREQEREARIEEHRERARYNERTASTWLEAFQKQANLCWREHNGFPEQNSDVTGDPVDDWFKDMAQANEKAIEIWKEIEAGKQAQLDELYKQIEAVKESIRLETADKLEAVSDKSAYQNTAQMIRDDELDSYLDW